MTYIKNRMCYLLTEILKIEHKIIQHSIDDYWIFTYKSYRQNLTEMFERFVEYEKTKYHFDTIGMGDFYNKYANKNERFNNLEMR